LVRLDDDGSDRGDVLAVLHPHRADALARTPDPTDVGRPDPLHLAGRRDRQEVLVLGADERARELAGLAGELMADDSLAASTLRRIVGETRPLDIPVPGHADHLFAVVCEREGDDLVAFR